VDSLHLGVSAEVTFHLADLAVPGGPLPRSRGALPLRWSDADDREVVVAPLARDEAVWLSFRAVEPVSLRIAIDGRDAVPGRRLVLPDQRWLDGFHDDDGDAAQVLGPDPGTRRKIHTVAHRLRGAAFRSWWNGSGARQRANRFGEHEMVTGGSTSGAEPRVPQRIEEDPYGDDRWEAEPFDEVEVQLLDPESWAEIVGEAPPA
jgi:hypothetical protein